VRAAVWQPEAGGAPAERIDRLAAAIEGAAIDLVLCPELFLTGYAIGPHLAALAEPAEGPAARRIAEIARAAGCAIAYGFPEAADGALYNACAVIGADGALVGVKRKTVLPPGFEADVFAEGDGALLFDCAGRRCAVLICYEVEFPEAVRAAALAGAEVILAPTALSDRWVSVAHRMIPTRAFENGVWLLYANHAGREGDTAYLGASCIVAPDGEDRARAGADEALITAALSMAPFAGLRRRLPYLADLGRLRRGLSGAASEE
jgi:predicted amidohydrolase